MESAGKMKQRHKKEARLLEKDLKKLGKRGKDVADARRAELAARHAQELAAVEGASEAGEAVVDAGDAGAGAGTAAESSGAGAGAGGEAGAGAGGAAAASADGDSAKARKKSKAQRRRERKAAAEAEREARVKAEEATLVDHRQVEIDQIEAQLAGLGYRIVQVTADGHCLYRAVAKQMALAGEALGAKDAVQHLRDAVAGHIRDHADEYAPYLEFEAADGAETDPSGALDKYCHRLQTSAVWGGQVETRALSTVLRHPIHVYQAAGPVQKMGEDMDTAPLRVSFHTAYYSLGFHYNSVEPR